MSKLTEFYTSLLDLCGIELGNHGRLIYRTAGSGEDESFDITLQYEGKPIVFPEKQFLSDPENKSGEVIILHPLSESSMRAPSEVQEVLRKAAIVRICEVGDQLLKRAITINHNATMDDSIKLNHKLSKLFLNADEVDVKFVQWFTKLDKAMQENSTYRLFHIFLRMHGEVGKNKFDRVAVISSPLYDELKLAKESTTIFGVEGGRKKDIATLIRILEALFPELASDNGYFSGSSSGTAPTLMAFMEAVALIAGRFNEVLGIYGKEAKGIERATTRGIDFDRTVKLSALRSAHPTEDYNIGVGKELSEKRHNAAPKEPVVLETRRTAPQDLSVPVRTTAPTTSVPASVKEDEDAGVPENAFWLDKDEDRRDSRRNSRYDERDDRDDRDRDRDRDYRGRDDRDYRDRDERRSYRDESRRSYRDEPRRSYRDDRDDRDRSYRDDRPQRSSRRSERESEFGQFWE